MKIQANVLRDFIKKATINEIDEILIEKKIGKGLVIMSKSPTEVSVSIAKMNANAFTVFGDDDGVFPIPNVKFFLNVLEVCGEDEVELIKRSVDGFSVLSINSAAHSANVSLSEPEIINSRQEKVPKIKFDTFIKVKKPFLNSLSKILKAIDKTEFDIVGSEKNIEFKITGDSGEMIGSKLTGQKLNDFTNVRIPTEQMNNVISVISEEDILINLGNDKPISIRERGENYLIEYFIAPRIEANTVVESKEADEDEEKTEGAKDSEK